jgi:hypothetical protein
MTYDLRCTKGTDSTSHQQIWQVEDVVAVLAATMAMEKKDRIKAEASKVVNKEEMLLGKADRTPSQYAKSARRQDMKPTCAGTAMMMMSRNKPRWQERHQQGMALILTGMRIAMLQIIPLASWKS